MGKAFYHCLQKCYFCSALKKHWKVVLSYIFLREYWAKHVSPGTIVDLSFGDALWTLQLAPVTSQAIKIDFQITTAVLLHPTIWSPFEPNSAAGIRVPALKCEDVFINKSEAITIKLLSVSEIIATIKEMIYSEDFKWHLLKWKNTVWKKIVKRWLHYYQ